MTESNSQGRFEARIANLNYFVVRRRNELNARRRELQASIERRESTERLRELTRRASEARDRLRESLEGYGVFQTKRISNETFNVRITFYNVCLDIVSKNSFNSPAPRARFSDPLVDAVVPAPVDDGGDTWVAADAPELAGTFFRFSQSVIIVFKEKLQTILKYLYKIQNQSRELPCDRTLTTQLAMPLECALLMQLQKRR